MSIVKAKNVKLLEIDEDGKTAILESFSSKILDDIQEMPPEFAKTLNDNFWGLLDDSKPI